MSHLSEMLRTHPRARTVQRQALESCIAACFDCLQACTSCADACLGEPDPRGLVACIRLNLDCADVCEATGKVTTRLTEGDLGLTRALLQTCVLACRACGEECRRHADHMEHCRVCAAACLACERACDEMLAVLAA